MSNVSRHMRLTLVFVAVFFSFEVSAADFAGHWRDDQPCGADGHGAHYTLTLKGGEHEQYTGTWESSTNTRGSSGTAYGRVVRGVLVLEGCTEESSWSEPGLSLIHI